MAERVKALARDLAGPWFKLEKHQLGTQNFIPLSCVRYLVLVSPGGVAPDVSTLAAFAIKGHQVTSLRPSVWRRGLLALVSGEFVVIERQSPQIDCHVFMLVNPVGIVLQ